MIDIFRIANRLLQPPEFPVVLATLVKVEGSSYRRVGARRLIEPNGDALGSISGGCLESDLGARALELITSSKNFDLIVYDTIAENDLLWGTGTGCRGKVHILLEKLNSCPAWAPSIHEASRQRRPVELQTCWDQPSGSSRTRGTRLHENNPPTQETGFVETVPPPLHLVIFGAGDDAIPLSHLARSVGWQNSICDARPQFATSIRFPHADTVCCLPAESAAAAFRWDDQTVAVVMTHHYRFDLPLLKTLLPLNLTYLGLLGPKARGQRLLKDAGYDPATTPLHNPIGLDLGGDGAEAVAMSITAQIQAHLHQRDGRPLSQRNRPIHD